MVRRAGPCDARRGRVRDYRWSGAPAEDLRRGLGSRHLGPVGQQHTILATTQARRRPVTVPDGHRAVSQPRSGRVGKARPEAAMGAGTDELIVGDRGLGPHVDTGTGPGWSLRTPKRSSTLTWTHGDRAGGLARSAHCPGASHAAAGPGGSKTARANQHGDPHAATGASAGDAPADHVIAATLTHSREPAPRTLALQTARGRPSRTRGSQAATPVVPKAAATDPHAATGPGPNASFPTRWHGDPHALAGARPPSRATRPPARSRPYAAAGAGTPRWDQGHAREADPTQPQGPGPRHGGGGHRGQRPYAAAGAGLFFLADFRTTTRAADTTIPARIARTKPRKFSMAKNTNTPP